MKDTSTENSGAIFGESQPFPLQLQSINNSSAKSSSLSFRQVPASWLPEGLLTLGRLESMQTNWDSYGAKAVNSQSIQLAKWLLDQLARIEDIEAPTLTASPSGNVTLCWDNGKRSLDVEIHADGNFSYVYLNEDNPASDQDGSTSDAGRLAMLLSSSTQ